MVRAIYGTGVLSQWLQEIPDGGTIDVISSFASPPLELGHHNIFDIHYPGNFLFYSGQCTRDLLEMLITEGAGDIRIFSGAYLHAKIYRVNWPNGHEDFIDNPSEERTFWAIGSANFTRPGLNSSTECITVFENGDSSPFTSEIWETMIGPSTQVFHIPMQADQVEKGILLDTAENEGWLQSVDSMPSQLSVNSLPEPSSEAQIPTQNSGWGFALTMTPGGGRFDYRYRIIPRSCYQTSQTPLHELIHPVLTKSNPEDDPHRALLSHNGGTHEIGIWTLNQGDHATTHLYLTDMPQGVNYDCSHVLRVSNLNADDGTCPVVDFPAISEMESSLNFYNGIRSRRWAIFDYPEEE